MFAKAAPASQQRDAAPQPAITGDVPAELALRTPHLSGRFGAMGMASPAGPVAAVGAPAAAGPVAPFPSRARKQLFTGGPAARGSGHEASSAAASGSASDSIRGGSADDRQGGNEAPSAAARAAHVSSQDASWPETGTVSSRRGAAGSSDRQLTAQHRKPDRKAARSRLIGDEAAGPSGSELASTPLPIALPPKTVQQPQALGHAAAAAVGAATQAVGSRQAAGSSGGNTPIDLITPERAPETVTDLTQSLT